MEKLKDVVPLTSAGHGAGREGAAAFEGLRAAEGFGFGFDHISDISYGLLEVVVFALLGELDEQNALSGSLAGQGRAGRQWACGSARARDRVAFEAV